MRYWCWKTTWMMSRRIWVGFILCEHICRGSQGGWVGWLVGIYLLFAFHSQCLQTKETWQRFITRGLDVFPNSSTHVEKNNFIIAFTTIILMFTNMGWHWGLYETTFFFSTPFFKADWIPPISNDGGVKTVGSFQEWKRFNCLPATIWWPTVSYHNLSSVNSHIWNAIIRK